MWNAAIYRRFFAGGEPKAAINRRTPKSGMIRMDSVIR
jgi:hypothetical protein